MKKENIKIFVGGFIIGIVGILLLYFGNPGNMGICIACFWRDIAGALGLHRAGVVQYIRPEIIGIIFGAFLSSILFKDFKGRGGSNPLIRFVLGIFMSIGALVFLGCPLRMIFRIAAGDLNAVVGLLGFVFGILIGILFLKKGYSLGKSVKESKIVGLIMPALAVMLLIFLLVKPAFIFFSKEGPGSMHAPIIISLVGGLVVGIILQRTRICTGGAFRDLFLIKDMHYLWGVIGIFVAAIIGNLILNALGEGHAHIGFENQPVAHTMGLWNFLGMTIVGLIAVMLGGCPIRQTVLSAEGDGDAAVTVFGIIIGAAIAHNFGLASSAEGATPNGKIATIIILCITLIIAFVITKHSGEE
ncbi:YedE family putative selenium transporter [Miniphocaeibacter massiliensis]|uniref:YedE family putative selenium transporter n=1 Tax=Miniphocaeibacter massiliensis TaxID=2041841 RepID=UPI000C1C2963|nr:YedE family putative selenium transporter [Miniphocaeibacter massiliensis]